MATIDPQALIVAAQNEILQLQDLITESRKKISKARARIRYHQKKTKPKKIPANLLVPLPAHHIKIQPAVIRPVAATKELTEKPKPPPKESWSGGLLFDPD